MKKLIAVFVVFALVAGAVFAETSISGLMEARTFVMYTEYGVNGKKADESEMMMKVKDMTGYIQLQATNDDGNMGATLRLRNNDFGGQQWHRAFVWWKPIDEIKIFLGQDADGLFGTDALEGWAYHQGQEGFLNNHDWDFWRGIFIGNWDTFGLAFSFYPMDGLDINLALPIAPSNGWPRHGGSGSGINAPASVFADVLQGIHFNANYALDFGKIMFTYIGPYNNFGVKTFDDGDYGQIGLSVNLSGVVEGLQIHPGFSTRLVSKDDKYGFKDADTPLMLGLGVFYDGGDFGVKFRTGVSVPTGDAEDFMMTVGVMPYFNLEVGKVCLDFGLSMASANKDADTEVGFWVNPYYKKSMGSGYFQIGIRLSSNIGNWVPGDGNHNVAGITKDAKTYFGIPMTMGLSF